MYNIKVNFLGMPEAVFPVSSAEEAREEYDKLRKEFEKPSPPYNKATVTMVSLRLDREMLVFMPQLY